MPIFKPKSSALQQLEEDAVKASQIHAAALDALDAARDKTDLVRSALNGHSESRFATAASLVEEGKRLATISGVLAPNLPESAIRNHFAK